MDASSKSERQRLDGDGAKRKGLLPDLEKDQPEGAVAGLGLLLPVGAHFSREPARGEGLFDLVDFRGRREVVETHDELLSHWRSENTSSATGGYPKRGLTLGARW